MPFMQRSSSSLKLRLIIAGVIAIGAVVTYLGRMEKNPLTGERQAVAWNYDQEIALGLRAAPQMAQKMGGVIDPNSSADARRVHEMGHRLVKAYKAYESKYAGSFNFYLLKDTQTVNAFALPGGQIFITKALYDQLENDAQLAGVLGHEIGHVIHRHSAEHAAKGELGQSLVGAVTVGAGDYSAGQIANMVNNAVQLKYGREDELQSDSWGLEALVAAGYDPNEMINVMQVLKRASGGGGRSPEIFASHPNPDQRIEEIRSYIKQRWPDKAR